MPCYEYECDKCDLVFGVITRLRDYEHKQRCPVCDSIARRIISKTSFALKGGCWEKDGYGNKREADKTKA
jgi:putative FmdB family regulatory protein